ncbi:uncharacterized protein [Amphiura filiformis]|uniref:uncharacterized protein n=1 Tax=Amphiura filiformis TaxID=82378 RepID=UPI003B20BBD6
MVFCMNDQLADTISLYRDSGIHQLYFLATALCRPVVLFEESRTRDTKEYFEYMLARPLVDNFEGIHVLHTRASSTTIVPNHYVPLVEGRKGLRKSKKRGRSKEVKLNKKLKDLCIMEKLGLCNIDETAYIDGGVSMIQCDRCFSWQHNICAGIYSVPEDKGYYCCRGDSDFDLFSWPIRAKSTQSKDKKVDIKMSDVWSTNPMCGLSATIVDFYVRWIQNEPNPNPAVYIFSALYGQDVQNGIFKRRTIDPNMNVFIFPVTLSENHWHWIAICFHSVDGVKYNSFVMDSLHCNWDPLVEIFWTYLKSLIPAAGTHQNVVCNVAKQQGNDCGLMLIQNIRELMNMVPLDADISTFDVPAPLSGDEMRKGIRKLLYETASGCI